MDRHGSKNNKKVKTLKEEEDNNYNKALIVKAGLI